MPVLRQMGADSSFRQLRVLIPIVAGIGNALMTVPMVRQLKRARPEARITILARIKAMGEVFERLPEVAEVRLMGKGNLGMLRGILEANLLRPHIALVPFPSNRWQYNMLAIASASPRRIIHSYPVARLRTLSFLPADRLPAVKGLHDVVQNLYLLRRLGIEPDITEAPSFSLIDEDRTRATNLFSRTGIDRNSRPIAIHPGSARTILATAKRWPARSYADLIPRLQTQFDAPVVLLEGPDEAGAGTEIASHMAGQKLRILRLTGPLPDAAAVLRHCRLYVGSDSGLAHLSAAVGTPPVTLFAPADPDRVCPFGYRHLVVQPDGRDCAPCFMYPWEAPYPKMRCRHPMCINDVTVDSVLEAARRALTIGFHSPPPSPSPLAASSDTPACGPSKAAPR